MGMVEMRSGFPYWQIQLEKQVKYVNQSNKHSNKMSEQRCFQLKQIIWAKIQAYPWWPGKVIGSLTQKNKKVYKISFFGDPTYCHLLSSSLAPFALDPPDLDNYRSSDLKLKKAITIARKVFSKSQEAVSQSMDYEDCPCQTLPHQPSAFDETKVESKQDIEIIPQKSSSNEPEIQNQNTALPIQQLVRIEVNQDSVIDILQSNLVSALTKQKGYNQRKIAFDFKQKLEFNLLRKYNLLDLDEKKTIAVRKVSQNPGMSNQTQKVHHRKFGKLRRHHKKSTHMIKSLCVRKLYSYLRSRNLQNGQAQTISIQLIARLQNLSGGQAHNNLQFRRNFLCLIQWLKRAGDQKLKNCEVLFLGQYLANSGCHFERAEDEEKSRATTISMEG